MQHAKQITLLALILMIPMVFGGCEIVGGILKVGFWAGAIFIILIVLIIMWLMKKMRGR